MYKEIDPQSYEIIRNLMDEHKQLSSMFIHELRNPLSLLKGTLQYIEMKYCEVKGYKYWYQLFDLIQDMEHMLSNASLLNSCTCLNIDDTDLLDLINNIVKTYMPEAEKQKKSLVFRHDEECEAVLRSYPCDAYKIKQTITNLVKNAFEATTEGNFIEIVAGIQATDSGEALSIMINNNGAKIPEEEIDDIFQPFVTHKAGGTGIGLALAKRIVSAHLSSISVSSSDELTSFSILLPIPKKQ